MTTFWIEFQTNSKISTIFVWHQTKIFHIKSFNIMRNSKKTLLIILHKIPFINSNERHKLTFKELGYLNQWPHGVTLNICKLFTEKGSLLLWCTCSKTFVSRINGTQIWHCWDTKNPNEWILNTWVRGRVSLLNLSSAHY